jgi:hypothetical protein
VWPARACSSWVMGSDIGLHLREATVSVAGTAGANLAGDRS